MVDYPLAGLMNRSGRDITDLRDEGLTRREALRRGAMAGLGLMWATPTVEHFALSAQFAQSATPVPEVEDTATEDEVDDVTVEPEVKDEVEDVSVEPEVKDEVLAEELPFTGLPAEQLIPLAGGLIATGAVAVRLARERQARPAAGTPEESQH